MAQILLSIRSTATAILTEKNLTGGHPQRVSAIAILGRNRHGAIAYGETVYDVRSK
jgi:hypothetical protein